MASRYVRRTGVYELTINLIREEIEVVFLYKVAYTVHLVAGVEVTCRVVRVADEYASCTFVDEFLEAFHRWQCKRLVNCRTYRADNSSGRYRKCHVVGICRFWNDNLIAGVKASEECEKHSLRAARGYDNVIGLEFYLILVVVADKFLTQREKTITWTIFKNLLVEILYGFKGNLGRVQVGLSDV